MTPEKLEEALREGYHVLHFVGHGVFNRAKDRGELLMEGPGGAQQHVTNDLLDAATFDQLDHVTPDGFTVNDTLRMWVWHFEAHHRDLILARHSMGPAALEEWNPNLVGGDIAGGRTDRLRMLFRPRFGFDPYTVAPGLYLCSSATPPGPGVHGMAGYHAAQRVLSSGV